MDKLSVYCDYVQSMALLRATRNRVVNALASPGYAAEDAAECRALCLQMYNQHSQRALELVFELQEAMRSRDGPRAVTVATALHRQNRLVARLSREFGKDIADEQIDTEKFYPNGPDQPPIPPPPINPQKTVAMHNFKQRLRVLAQELVPVPAAAAAPRAGCSPGLPAACPAP